VPNLSAIRRRRHRPETGFSLIELMIVLLIIAILLAVAIPTYLSARNRAENRAAQETLAHVMVSAQADYASQNSFVPLSGHKTMASYLTAGNPGVTVTPPTSSGHQTAVTKPGEVSEVNEDRAHLVSRLRIRRHGQRRSSRPRTKPPCTV